MRGIFVPSATIAILLVAATAVDAQECAPPSRPYFDFQVEQPATFILDTSVSPRPAQRVPGQTPEGSSLVQFVVDARGVPDTLSYKVLRTSDLLVAERGRRAMVRWRFIPARVGGCPVPQLVQTVLQN